MDFKIDFENVIKVVQRSGDDEISFYLENGVVKSVEVNKKGTVNEERKCKCDNTCCKESASEAPKANYGLVNPLTSKNKEVGTKRRLSLDSVERMKDPKAWFENYLKNYNESVGKSIDDLVERKKEKTLSLMSDKKKGEMDEIATSFYYDILKIANEKYDEFRKNMVDSFAPTASEWKIEDTSGEKDKDKGYVTPPDVSKMDKETFNEYIEKLDKAITDKIEPSKDKINEIIKMDKDGTLDKISVEHSQVIDSAMNAIRTSDIVRTAEVLGLDELIKQHEEGEYVDEEEEPTTEQLEDLEESGEEPQTEGEYTDEEPQDEDNGLVEEKVDETTNVDVLKARIEYLKGLVKDMSRN